MIYGLRITTRIWLWPQDADGPKSLYESFLLGTKADLFATVLRNLWKMAVFEADLWGASESKTFCFGILALCLF